MSARDNVLPLQPSIDLAEAAFEEGMTEQKAKDLLRRIARKSTGALIFKAVADERQREINREVARGESAEAARQRARGERP